MGCIFTMRWVFPPLGIFILVLSEEVKMEKIDRKLFLFFFISFFFPPSGVIVRDLHQKCRLNAMQVKSSDLYELYQ